MILSGIKSEEYRALSPYYQTRFQKLFCDNAPKQLILRNGYSKASPACQVTATLRIGTGKQEWGAEPGTKYFILSILSPL